MGPGIQRSTLDLEPHSNKESIFILWLRATSGKNNFEHWARLSISFLVLVNPLSWEIGLLSPDINWFRTKTTELDNYNVVSVMELLKPLRAGSILLDLIRFCFISSLLGLFPSLLA